MTLIRPSRRGFGAQQLTDAEQAEARRLALKARSEFGSAEAAAKVIGVGTSTLATVAVGNYKAGRGTYQALKKWEASCAKE